MDPVLHEFVVKETLWEGTSVVVGMQGTRKEVPRDPGREVVNLKASGSSLLWDLLVRELVKLRGSTVMTVPRSVGAPPSEEERTGRNELEVRILVKDRGPPSRMRSVDQV